jgi:hypothetical protein
MQPLLMKLSSWAPILLSTLQQSGKPKTKPKCQFFAWLATHNKALTIDNLMKKNWPCNPNCALCYCVPETNNHLIECNFTRAVGIR